MPDQAPGAWFLPAAKSVSEANGLSEDKTRHKTPHKEKHDGKTIIEKKPYGTARTVGL
jgi:hypothetical protein